MGLLDKLLGSSGSSGSSSSSSSSKGSGGSENSGKGSSGEQEVAYSSSTTRSTGVRQTDIYYGGKGSVGGEGHGHIAIDEYGVEKVHRAPK